MSHAQKTAPKPANKKRIGGPRPADQTGAHDAEIEELGSVNESESGDQSSDDAGEPAQGSSASFKAKRNTDPPPKPATRQQTKLVAQELTGKEEAGTAKKKAKAQKANQREEDEEYPDVEEQEEFLLRERSMEAMEQRLRAVLMAELRKEQQLAQGPAAVPSSVTKALYSIVPLKEKEFDVWLSHVDDAFRGATMSAMFRASAVRSDALAGLARHRPVSTLVEKCCLDRFKAVNWGRFNRLFNVNVGSIR